MSSSTGAPTPSSTSTAAGKAPRVLACVLCQHRKIKCDRNTPCSNCVKASVTCTPSTPAPARKRRRPNQDLQERLARCEALLKNYASAAASSEPEATAAALSAINESIPSSVGNRSSMIARDPSKYPEPMPPWAPAGKVVVEDGSTRFVDSFLWSKLHDELNEMRRIIEVDEAEDHSTLASEAPTPEDATDLLLGDYASMSIDDAYPEPVHVFRLWQIFLERVNPLCKIIHVPSVQPYVVEVASGNWNVPANYQPLLFSIFSIAVFALSDSESRQMLGLPRETALKKFTSGVRAALMKVNFMKTYDLLILQSLAFYQLALLGRHTRHASWIFSGVCIRIAQKMGLHRDGESLNLTPFETEMRRRLWWQLVILDAMWALLSGMSYPVVSVNWTTKLPRNVNDADLFPGSSEPIQEREGPTEMGFCLLMATVWGFVIKVHHQFPGFEAAILGFDVESIGAKDRPRDGSAGLVDANQQQKYKALMGQLSADIARVQEKYIDPGAGAAHLVASKFPHIISTKVQELFTPLTELPEYGTEIFTTDDNLFRLGVLNLESNMDMYDMMNTKGFFWYCRLHFQIEMITAMVGQMITRQTGSYVDRAWTGLEMMYRYHEELFDMSQKANVTLRSFVLKAWRGRTQALAQQGQTAVVPHFVQELIKGLPDGRMSESATPISMTSSAVSVMGTNHKPSSRELSGASMKWEFGPTHGGSVMAGADTATFGPGLMDIGPVDWDMFAESMASGQGQQGTGPGMGFGAMGPNMGHHW